MVSHYVRMQHLHRVTGRDINTYHQEPSKHSKLYYVAILLCCLLAIAMFN